MKYILIHLKSLKSQTVWPLNTVECESTNSRQSPSIWKLTLQTNAWVKEGIIREIGKYLKLNDNKNMGCS